MHVRPSRSPSAPHPACPRRSSHRQRPEPRDGHSTSKTLGRYRDRRGAREIVARPAGGGSVLVIDWDARTLEDRRLLARLGPEESSANAALVCRLYLEDRDRHRVLPRPVSAEDLEQRVADLDAERGRLVLPVFNAPLVVATGHRLSIEAVPAAGMSIPELRWLCRPPLRSAGPAHLHSVREVIGRLQDYEPARTLSLSAVSLAERDATVSAAVLRAELARVAASRIILNRRLRETVLAVVARDGLSMSQIAVRCGRTKRDTRGNVSGETSWLARRLGLLPEGGLRAPTPWIHSDVLALIARSGLGVCPREVELG